MEVNSPEFKNGDEIPSEFTCDGENVNPPLIISDVNESVRELVLIVDDPDAPGGLFTHWIVGKIPATIRSIVKNSIPPTAIVGTNDFGEAAYGGPCPPSGIHRYRFNLYALDTEIDFSSVTDRSSVDSMITNHVLDSAQLVGLYARK
jgi:Raf kinase inhibitor-like YbhB/YbcL family protein